MLEGDVKIAIRGQLPAWLWLRRRLLVSMVGTAGLVLPEGVLAGAPGPAATIRVRVNNYTQASNAVLASAEREAGRIFGEAGLTLVWLTCPPSHSSAVQQDPCHEAPQATDIILRILAAPTRNEFQDTVFGFAVRPLFASVYYDRVVRRAIRDDAEFEVHFILGCVMAHEIGHLLIGSNGHSSSGVMQASWERKQIRQAVTSSLLFTPQQARQIQAAAQMRTKLRAAVPRCDGAVEP